MNSYFQRNRPQLNRRQFLAGACASMAARTASAATPLNFLFILIDDMGWRDLGCYGSTFYETPNIDRLAAQSVRFTNAYAACPVCSPTRASILTGKYPARLQPHRLDPGPGAVALGAADHVRPSSSSFRWRRLRWRRL